MSVRRADPDTSRVVLVGTPFYTDPGLQDLPGVANNITDLTAVLTDPGLGGLDPAHCVVAPPDADQAAIGGLLTEAADQAEDMLLFYFAGHGLLGPTLRRELYLGLAGSRTGRQVPFTALKFTTVHDAWLDSPARNKIVILDCCFSGRALLGASMADDDVLGQLEVAGSYTLTASPANSPALAPPGERNTAFTARLLKLLREGTPQAGPILSMEDIYRHLRAQMLAARLPEPQQIGTATAAMLGLVRNRYHETSLAAAAQRTAPSASAYLSTPESAVALSAVAPPTDLPEELRERLDSRYPHVRAAAVAELALWLAQSDPELVAVVHAVLEDVAANDLPQVAGAARAVLANRTPAPSPVPATTSTPVLPVLDTLPPPLPLGLGLVSVPPTPDRPVLEALMATPTLQEYRRFCGQCSNPVGRGRDGRPGPTIGLCPKCGQRFSFEPLLKPGDKVGEYEILGCLTYGGMDWIYAGSNRSAGGRPVVLKRMLGAGSSSAGTVIDRRRFLTEIDDPRIVETLGFVTVPDPALEDVIPYTVMEYLGGMSLSQIRRQRAPVGGGFNAPSPIAEAIAYMIAILPAFTYLHERGLSYPDFKPDNVIKTGDQLKLIDLDCVIHRDAVDADIYGTWAYLAPEINDTGVSVQTDLYAVGRTLTALAVDIQGFHTTHRQSLPSPADEPLFARHGSFHRFLLRATNPAPELRFESATQMEEELTAVLHDVVAAGG